MNVTVLGANGRVGSLVVDMLLEDGHHVTGYVHKNRNQSQHENLRYVEGDVHSEASVAEAIRGSQAVISTLGSWGTPTKDIVSTGIKALIATVHDDMNLRVVTLTGADSRASGDRLGVLHNTVHWVASKLAGKILFDGEQHIAALEASSLNWTVVRSPVMNNNADDAYTLSSKRPLPWQTISRRAVARCLVDQIDDVTWQRQAPFIHR